MKHVVAIKPLSVNRAWQGKRYKTESYKTFEQNMNFLLPKKIEIPAGNLKVTYEFGLSNMLADVDNQLKPLQDILQHKYGFNDARIYEISAKKRKVKKGMEYVAFEINSLEECLDDGFGNSWSSWCGNCGSKSMEIVRPGKVQCGICG